MESIPNDIPPETLLGDSAWIRRLARRLVRDEHLAEDLSQDALAVALERGRHVPSGAASHVRDLRPWLTGVVKNLARLSRRSTLHREEREQAVARSESTSSPAAPVEALRRAELQQQVVAAVLRLDEPYRTTVLLRYLEELPVEEVAARMATVPSTVRGRTKRALEQLRGRLVADRDGDEHSALAALGFLAGMPQAATPAAGTSLPTQTLTLLTWMNLHLKAAVALVLLITGSAYLVIAWTTLAPLDRDPDTRLAVAPGDVQDVPRVAPAPTGEPSQESAPTRTTVGSQAQVTTSAAEGQHEQQETFGESTLQTRVVNAAGEPVPGARVRLHAGSPPGRSGMDPGPVLHELFVPEDGTVRFEGLEPFLSYTLRVTAEGYSPLSRNEPAGEVEDLILFPVARLTGRVLNEIDGTPIAGAFVGGALSAGRRSRVAPVTTESDGSFALEELPGGKLIGIEVVLQGSLPFSFDVRLKSKGETRHDLRIPPRGELVGTVVELDTGRGVPRATLTAGWNNRTIGVTGPDGRFRVSLAASKLFAAKGEQVIETQTQGDLAGDYLGSSISAHAQGYTRTSAPTWLPAEDSYSTFLVPLAKAASIVGTVSHPDGRPAAGLSITWSKRPVRFLSAGAMACVGPDSESTTTDSTGHFELLEVPWAPDFGGVLQVSEVGVRLLVITDACPAAAGETRALELTLGPQDTLHGRFLVNGRAEAGYIYQVLPNEQPGLETKTDEQGRFSFTGIEEGTLRFEACTADGSSIWSDEHSVEFPLPAGEVFEIHLRGEFPAVSGRVLDERGRGLEGADLIAYHQSEAGRPGRGSILAGFGKSRPDGSFRMRLSGANVPTAMYTIATIQAGSVQQIIDVLPGRDDLEFVLPQLIKVQLVLTDAATGAPVRKAKVSWCETGTETSTELYSGIEIEATPEGLLQIELPLGLLDLEVSAPSLGLGVTMLERVSVDAEGRTELHVELAASENPTNDG